MQTVTLCISASWCDTFESGHTVLCAWVSVRPRRFPEKVIDVGKPCGRDLGNHPLGLRDETIVAFEIVPGRRGSCRSRGHRAEQAMLRHGLPLAFVQQIDADQSHRLRILTSVSSGILLKHHCETTA